MPHARILIVEDENIVALDIERSLQRLGYEVVERASRGEEAIEKAAAHRPDLVLMDIRLKGEMSGIEAADTIRKHSGVPIVFLTACADEQTLQRAKLAEPFGYLLKPFDERELRTVIEVALHKHATMATAQAQTAEALREAEEQLKLFVESVRDYAIFTLDPRGRILTWNAGAERIKGYARQDVIGKHFSIFFPAEEIQRERPEQALKIAAANGRFQMEGWRLRKDGSRFWADVIITPIRDGEGNLHGFGEVSRDITERTKAETALRESGVRMRLATEATGVGLWEWNVVTNKIRWDAQMFRIYGIPPTRSGLVEYSTWSGAVLPEDLPEQERVLQDTVRRIGRSSREFRIHRADDGECRSIQAVETVRTDGQGRAEWVVGTNLDITERKRTEEEIRRLNAELEQRVVERTAQLEAANKELEAFSYSVSHDLRAPLRAVDGFSQAVLEDFGPQLPAEGQRYLQTIRGGAQRMGLLIDDLLAFSRLSRAPVNKQEVNTGELVRGVLADLSSMREGRKIDLRLGELPACLGDAALLKQVWINLISNALKYTQKRAAAVVEIGCERTAEGDVYFVRDNGTGFDMRYAGKLFGVFQRLHRAEEFEGTGVGLAIVQRVIHRHGGRVWAEAEEDRGATFHFTLEERTGP